MLTNTMPVTQEQLQQLQPLTESEIDEIVNEVEQHTQITPLLGA